MQSKMLEYIGSVYRYLPSHVKNGIVILLICIFESIILHDVLGAQIRMHLGVYKLKSHLSCNSFCVLIHKKNVLPLRFELGIA